MKSKILAIAFCLFIGSGISYADLRNGLVSGWSFDDGTAKDLFGDNDGEIEGAVDVVEGRRNKALSFDGQGGYVDLGDTSNFPNGSSQRTVAFWTLLRGQELDRYFMCWGECLRGGAFFAPRINGGNISLMVNDTGVYDDMNSATPLGEILEVWSHLVYTYDGSTTVEIYLNGSLFHSGETGADLDTSTGHDAYIGARNCFDGPNNGIDASIDEVYLWDRALSEDEIASLPEAITLLAVERPGKLSTLWGIIKR